jgi:hypothetical protein
MEGRKQATTAQLAKDVSWCRRRQAGRKDDDVVITAGRQGKIIIISPCCCGKSVAVAYGV